MNTLYTLILSTLCLVPFISCSSTHSSTHKEALQYDLAQRKTTQKFVTTIRNITSITSLMGLISYIYIRKQQYAETEQMLAMMLSRTQESQFDFEPPKPLPLYLSMPMAVSTIGLLPSLITLVTSTLYGIYNNMHIETLQGEITKLEQTEFANK